LGLYGPRTGVSPLGRPSPRDSPKNPVGGSLGIDLGDGGGGISGTCETHGEMEGVTKRKLPLASSNNKIRKRPLPEGEAVPIYELQPKVQILP